MDEISFKRYWKYWVMVLLHTVQDAKEFLWRLKDDFMQVLIPFAAYVIAIYATSLGLLSINNVNAFFEQFGAWAQLFTMIGLIGLSFVFGILFVTPVKLYYEQKSKGDRDNWNDVYFGEVIPQYKNLLGFAVIVKNEKLTAIEDLSVWVVSVQPGAFVPVGKGKRFGYVNQYETDIEPVFSSFNLPAGQEKAFVIANFDEEDNFILRARHPNEGKLEDEIHLSEGDYVLDIEYRAFGVRAKLIRYSLTYLNSLWHFDKYEHSVRYKKYYR